MFIDELYEDLGHSQWFDDHLQECPECNAAFKKLSATLDVMDKRECFKPEELYWDGYWDRLVTRFDAQKKNISIYEKLVNKIVLPFQMIPKWAYSTAFASLLIIFSFMLGKFHNKSPNVILQNNSHIAQSASALAHKASIEKQANRYLQRSKVLMLGLINFDVDNEGTYGLNIPYQKEISQNLLNEARTLKNELHSTNQQRLRKLISDLEIILLQIANLEVEHNLSSIELIKSSVEHRSILLKINLEEMKQVDDSKSVINGNI